MTDADQVSAVVERIADRRNGRLQGLVNNAGLAVPAPVEAATDAEWSEIFAVNVFGPARLDRWRWP